MSEDRAAPVGQSAGDVNRSGDCDLNATQSQMYQEESDKMEAGAGMEPEKSAQLDNEADQVNISKFMDGEDIWMYAGWLPILATLHPVEASIPRKKKKATGRNGGDIETVNKNTYAKYDMMWKTPRLNHNVPKMDKMCQIINNGLGKVAGPIKEEGKAFHWPKLDNDAMNIVGYKQVSGQRHNITLIDILAIDN